MKSFLIIIFLFLGFSTSTAQRSTSWLKLNKIKNYHEGVYILDVNSQPIDLVSIIAYWEPYLFGKGDSLKIRFYSPQDSISWIKSEEIYTNQFYWFQSDFITSAEGWNEFENWHIDNWLKHLHLLSNNLGMIIKYGPKENHRFLPAWVYNKKLPTKANFYIAQLRLGMNIKGGSYSIYKEDSPKDSKPAKKGKILGLSGGACFQIVIPLQKLETSGWYKVDVNINKRGTNGNYNYCFYFFHNKN